MARIRRMKSFTLFRILVVPSMLLCAIFRAPVFQWIAVAAVLIWLAVVIVQSIRPVKERAKQAIPALDGKIEQAESPKTEQSPEPAVAAEEMTPESRLFLIRQVNYRITEQLKANYPMVAWLWVKRPEAEQLCKGGVFRIRTSNTDPFNYGEVEMDASGRLTITMLQAISLKDTAESAAEEKDDLRQEELLERVDVKDWYRSTGEDLICQMIDNLNTQGHKKLLIKEDGQVVILAGGKEQPVELIQDFPPRMAWDDFCQLLREDEIHATVQQDGLLLAWGK